MAYTPDNPYLPGDPYAYDLKWIVAKVKELIAEYTAQQSEIGDLTDDVNGLASDFANLQSYVENYFASLDLTTEVDAILQQMYNDGYFDGLFSNVNFVDNPFFTINQRGVSTFYTGQYGPDRWRGESASADPLLLTSSGVTVFVAPYMSQILEADLVSQLNDKNVTCSVKLADGTIKSGTALFDSTANRIDFIGAADGIYLYFYRPTTKLVVQGIDANGITVRAVKLELGTISTLKYDIAPNKNSELIKCMAYYQQSWVGSVFPPSPDALLGVEALTAWTANGTAPCHFYVPMRTAPAITIYSPAGNTNEVRDPSDNSTASITGAGRITPQSFEISASGTLTAGHIYQFHYKATADL